MRRLLDWLEAHRFVRHNLIYFVGAMTTAVLNYLYYPVLGRILGLGAFGDVQVLVSLFAQVAIFYGALGMVTANVVANVADPEQRDRIVEELRRLAILIMVGVSLIALALAGPIANFLRLSDGRAFFALIVSLALTVPLTLSFAYLQGRQRFAELSFISILNSGCKLLAAAALVLAGGAAFGAIGGITVAQIITLGVVTVRLRRAGYRPAATGSRFRRPDLAVLRPELRYAALVLVVSLITTLLYTGDIIVVKHYFAPEAAGAYAGISTIARILFFLTSSIGAVMFPAIKLTGAAAENRRVLRFSLGLVALLGGGGLALFSLAPGWIIHLMLGARYVQLAYLLPTLSLAVFAVSLSNILFLYNLALRRTGVAVIALGGGLLTAGLFIFSHASLTNVVTDMAIGSVSTLIGLGLYKLKI